MKMARASEIDLEAALDVSRILEELGKGYMPSDGEHVEWFDREDPAQCQRALGALLDAAAKGSIFRVTFGMTVVLDPRNELLDPAADTLEKHPKTVAALATSEADREGWNAALEAAARTCGEWAAERKPEAGGNALRNCADAIRLLDRATPPPAGDPMDWPLPCDVTVGHGTMRKGVSLRTLVSRMKTLYEMATGNDADAIANRTLEERQALAAKFLAAVDPHGAEGWCCEKGQAAGAPVCDECAEISAGYSAAMAPIRKSDEEDGHE
jgi:hypothetical protein